MVEKMWDYHERSSTISTSQEAKKWNERSNDSKLNEILHRLDKEIRWQSESNKSKKAQKLHTMVILWKYEDFQKEIWMTNCDWKLWGETFDNLKNYLENVNQLESNEKNTNHELNKLSLSITKPQNVQESLNSKYNNNKLSPQYGGLTLSSLGNNEQSRERWIFNERPKLWVLWNKLRFDFSSKIDSIKPHLDDLNQLSNKTLSKISKTVNYICISDKTITNWSTNSDLLWVTPRWYTGGKDWSYVWGCFRNWIVYAWLSKRLNWKYYNYKEECSNRLDATDSIILHEIWHAFDSKNKFSKSSIFKSFHRKFYNRLWSYFQQWWPWWDAWCSEFFAEATAEFNKWWKEGFTKYYSQDFYNYMSKILS